MAPITSTPDLVGSMLRMAPGRVDGIAAISHCRELQGTLDNLTF